MMHYSEVDGANSDEKFISVCKQFSDVEIIASSDYPTIIIPAKIYERKS